LPWGVAHIRSDSLWPHYLGQGVRVAIIDTGIQLQHPDLKEAIGAGYNVLNPGAQPSDDNGHGTHIAGTIAAYGQRSGIIGVAPATTLHPVKAFDAKGSAYVHDLVAGINWCVRAGIPIINMSFGIHANSPSLRRAVTNAARQGTLIIASAGNDGNDQEVDYPAKYESVISVGASNRDNELASFSNDAGRVDFYAPGVAIESCHRMRSYRTLSGTSMAAAHVSGALAQLMSAYPEYPHALLIHALQATATPLESKKTAVAPRAGVINVWAAFEWLKGYARRQLTFAQAH
jgi:subtilisin family serine protease